MKKMTSQSLNVAFELFSALLIACVLPASSAAFAQTLNTQPAVIIYGPVDAVDRARSSIVVAGQQITVAQQQSFSLGDVAAVSLIVTPKLNLLRAAKSPGSYVAGSTPVLVTGV